MKGIERLRDLARGSRICGSVWQLTNADYCSKYGLSRENMGGSIDELLLEIADQIERETARDAEEREAVAWVREQGGLAEVREYYECGRRIEPWNEQKADLYELMNECGGVEELKKRLMPEGMEWPRFEDGEPVMFGDVVSDGDETGRVYYVTFDTVNPVIIGFTDETPDQDPGTWLEVSVNDGDRVKRPAPKVLDADGVEIRVGDTVYDMVGDRHEVKGFGKQGDVLLEFHNDESLGWRPSNFTHRAPVLAADGKPLREGETVYTLEDHRPYTVEAVCDTVAIRAVGGGVLVYRAPWALTHEQPDSWERIESDLSRVIDAGEDGTGTFNAANAYCDRHGLGGDVLMAMMQDLVRRAKKLAGVEK